MTDKGTDNRRKCPVCGRFARTEAVEKHEKAVNAMREALAECREAIGQKDSIIDTMKASLSLYETEHDKFTAKVANQKGELSRREKTIAALRDEILSRAKTIDSMALELEEAKAELDGLKARLDAYRGRGLWARIINKDI